MSEKYRIGRIAALTGCSAETIRHYEKLGLLQKPARSAQGYRYYDHHALQRIGFIRHGRSLGLDLHSIQELLDLADNPDADCSAADAIATHHLLQLEKRITSLQALADELRQVIKQCRGGTTSECRIIQALFEQQSEQANTGRTEKTDFRARSAH